MRCTPAVWFVVALAMLSYRLDAQSPVTSERLLNAAKEGHNWLTYGGDYFSHRYSPLTQITPANVKSLNLTWAYQSPLTGSWQATPVVVDGIMYLTQRPNDVVASTRPPAACSGSIATPTTRRSWCAADRTIAASP